MVRRGRPLRLGDIFRKQWHWRRNKTHLRQNHLIDFQGKIFEDVKSWLKLIRLYQYKSVFAGLPWQRFVMLDDAELESRGVNDAAARQCLLEVFDRLKRAEAQGRLMIMPTRLDEFQDLCEGLASVDVEEMVQGPVEEVSAPRQECVAWTQPLCFCAACIEEKAGSVM